MKQLTIRGLDDELSTYVREFANEKGISLNRAVLQILRKGAGLDRETDIDNQNVIGNSMDHLIGTWSAAQAREFDEAIKVFSQIDQEMWE